MFVAVPIYKKINGIFGIVDIKIHSGQLISTTSDSIFNYEILKIKIGKKDIRVSSEFANEDKYFVCKKIRSDVEKELNSLVIMGNTAKAILINNGDTKNLEKRIEKTKKFFQRKLRTILFKVSFWEFIYFMFPSEENEDTYIHSYYRRDKYNGKSIYSKKKYYES